MTAIEVKNLTKNFGTFCAVNNISFSVNEGAIFGFLGANGAGKTTTIKMLCGILQPTSGKAIVSGFDVDTQRDNLKLNIGYMSQRFSLYDDLTVLENIFFFGGIYRLSGDKLKQRANWVIEMAGLKGKENNLTSSLSGGWKQRLALGCSFIHEPKILFLDEPTAGVDPISRLEFWSLIKNLAKSGVTILVTTHYMDEAEYCDSLTLMEDGKIIANDSPSNLKAQALSGKLYEVSAEPFSNAVKALSQIRFNYIEPFGLKLHILNSDPSVNFPQMIHEKLSAVGCNLNYIHEISPTLEDVFLALVGKAQKQKAVPA